MTLAEFNFKWVFPVRHITPAIGGVCPATGFDEADGAKCNCGGYQLFLNRLRDFKSAMEPTK